MIVPRLIIGVAVVLAAVLARRSPAHWPVPIALGLALAGDVTRAALELPPVMELGLYLAAPALSAWCALRVLAGLSRWAAPVVPLILWAAVLRRAVTMPETWAQAPLFAHAGALLVQVVAGVLWWRSPRPRDTPETCALVLAAGDVLGLAGPLGLGGPWWIVAAQAGIVGAALVLVQGRALTRDT